MSVRLDLVYNPFAGNFRQQRLDALASELSAQGFEPRLVATMPTGVTIAPDAELVCIHGGDGTARMVAQALGERASTVPLAISPVGTINLLARELGYASDPRRFAAQLASAWSRGRDSWVCSPLAASTETPVLACLSIGPDSVAVANVSGNLKARIGRVAYVVSALAHLGRWPRSSFRLELVLADGSEACIEAEAAFLARGRFYAGPFRLSHRAHLASENLELVVLERAGRLRVLALFCAIAFGLCPARLGIARTFSVRQVRMEDCPLPVQVDGDAIGSGPFTLGMSGQILRFCV